MASEVTRRTPFSAMSYEFLSEGRANLDRSVQQCLAIGPPRDMPANFLSLTPVM